MLCNLFRYCSSFREPGTRRLETSGEEYMVISETPVKFMVNRHLLNMLVIKCVTYKNTTAITMGCVLQQFAWKMT